jgi:hypothetical protein
MNMGSDECMGGASPLARTGTGVGLGRGRTSRMQLPDCMADLSGAGILQAVDRSRKRPVHAKP